MNRKLIEKICILLLFLSTSFSICYWAIAKYNVYDDFRSSDANVYIKMSQHDYTDVPRRFRYRVLMPEMVAFLNQHLKIENFLSRYYLDVDKKTIQLNFGIINIFAIAFTGFLFFYYCRLLGFLKWESLVAAYLFFTSFFVVTYYSIPMVDSLASFFIMAGFYAVLKGSLAGIFLSFLFGVFTKETAFVIPLLIVISEKRIFTKKLLACLPGAVLYILFIKSLSGQFKNSELYIFNNLIDFNLAKTFILNSFREFNLYAVIENIQVFMFAWILFFYGLFKCKKPLFIRRSLWLLLLIIIMPPMVGCAAVGRVAFYLFPVVIPVVLLAIRDIFSET